MNFPELKNIETLSKEEQVVLKKKIILQNALDVIPVTLLPTPVSEDYYFISYSHKNYREVYCDLFDLDSVGFPFWYDRGIPAGNSWKDIAIKYLEPFDCKGVLFYISEEALTSDAIYDEINFTLDTEKPFIAIFLGKENSINDLIVRLYAEKKISVERYNFFLDVFKEENIYLRIKDPAETKKEKILNNLPRQKILSLSQNEENDYLSKIISIEENEPVIENDEKVKYVRITEAELNIDGSNNYYLKEIKKEDYLDALTLLHDEKYLDYNADQYFEDDYEEMKTKFIRNKDTDEVDIKCKIESFSFANLKYLEKIELPYNATIGDSSFGNLKRLKDISFFDFKNKKRGVTIEQYAFKGCDKIETFDFSYVTEIKDGAFEKCYKLKEVNLGKNYKKKDVPFCAFNWCLGLEKVTLNDNIEVIGECAFNNTNIKSIKLPKNTKEIRHGAFANILNLKKITLNEGLEEIDDEAFNGSGIVHKITLELPSSIKHIGESAFSHSGIKTIKYNGTYKDFMKLANKHYREWKKGDDIFYVELICNDKETRLVDKDKGLWFLNII